MTKQQQSECIKLHQQKQARKAPSPSSANQMIADLKRQVAQLSSTRESSRFRERQFFQLSFWET
jgi:hypothetical protein